MITVLSWGEDASDHKPSVYKNHIIDLFKRQRQNEQKIPETIKVTFTVKGSVWKEMTQKQQIIFPQLSANNCEGDNNNNITVLMLY